MKPLALQGVSMSFGGLRVIEGIDLEVEAGERIAILGPNGAGKTTLFNIIGGQLRPTGGRVMLFGHDATHIPVHRRFRLGLSRTFQISNLLWDLTVEENVRMAVHGPAGGTRPFVNLWGVPAKTRARCEELLRTWGLWERRADPVRQLSYGEQRQLEILLAVAGEPRLLLLDEPTAGLSAAETEQVTAIVRNLDPSLTVLLIEHDMDVAFQVAERVIALHQGRIIADGTPEEIQKDERVQEIYFGSS